MLSKLLKYEFKATGLRFLSSFAVYIVAVGALLLFSNIAGSSWQVLALFLISLCIFGLFIVLFLTLFQRYNANLYGSEGYLMFTLPVKGKMLLLSKLISTFVWVMLYGIVSALTVSIIAARYGAAVSVIKLFNAVWTNRGKVPQVLLISAVTISFISMAIYFAITVSKLPVWRGAGTLMGIVTFFAVHTLLSIPTIIRLHVSRTVSVLKNGHTQIFVQTNALGQVIGSVWFTAGYMLVLSVALFFATAYLMERHTSLK